jgi:hypothetical protein
LREHLRRVEKLALHFRPRFLPRKPHHAVGRQEAFEFAARTLGTRRAGKLELRVRGQAFQCHWLQGRRHDTEIHAVPAGPVAHRGVELDAQRKFAGLVKHQNELSVLEADAPVRMAD